MKKIEKYLLSVINKDSPVETEKVGRYLKNIEMYRQMDKTVKEEGVSVTTENGSQSFIKAHPLLGEMNKVNSAIINIERSFNIKEVVKIETSMDDLV